MKHIVNRLSRTCYQPSLALLCIRVAAGIVFIHHVAVKFQTLPMTERFFMFLGFPAWMGLVIAFIEVVGGLMLVFGVLSRVAGVVLSIEMLVAIFITGFSHGLSPHEFEFVLFMITGGIALGGSGKYSLYAMECRHCSGMLCKGECQA